MSTIVILHFMQFLWRSIRDRDVLCDHPTLRNASAMQLTDWLTHRLVSIASSDDGTANIENSTASM